MSKKNRIPEENQSRAHKKAKEEKSASEPSAENPISRLQQQVGNQAVQRLIAQRSGEGPSELDDDTAGRIDSARGGGQSLDSSVQKKMGDAMGADFSDVRVHTGKEANELNRDVGAEAFTTGHDIFFKEGNYQPNTSAGDELLAHELTHVVQQGQGRVGGSGGGMTVNAPGDSFEQEADRVASAVTGPTSGGGEVQRQEEAAVQRQDVPEDELQMQEMEEDELQLQEEEEEEMVQAQPIEEEEEMMMPKRK